MYNKTGVIAVVVSMILSLYACRQYETAVSLELNSGWTFRKASDSVWYPASVPGTVHTDLLENNNIEDPFYRTNELDQQYIDKEDWIYSNTFVASREMLNKEFIDITFYGLDTYAEVTLNGNVIITADNMFRTWSADITPYITEGENTLTVYLKSPINEGLKKLEKSPYPLPASNDQSERGGLGDKQVSIFTRKAGYHYGWDWGPRLVTSGIWRPVIISGWNSAGIEDIFIKQVDINTSRAIIEAEITINSLVESDAIIDLSNGAGARITKEAYLTKGSNIINIPMEIADPRLWWSKGLGEQNMYTFTAELIIDGSSCSSRSISTGLRSLRLVRDKDEAGETFYFELNGMAVYAKGANYIPNDIFLPRVTREKYEKVVADAADANMNMLRVWGGGVYEDDYFYQLCDEKGIMIWQDFMFACSMYPGDEPFLENVRQEAIDNVTRLRNHPSIALWCGNNENNTAWASWGWKQLYDDYQREEINNAYIEVFHNILPSVVSDYTDGDDYWPSSPQSGTLPENTASSVPLPSGDMHYWGVWHGQHPFENFYDNIPRFMSEYGFQSFPDFETVQTYTIPADHDIESEVMSSHQRSGIGNLRIKQYMEMYYPVPESFEEFLYMSQVLQSYGMKMGIEAQRSAKPYCMGSLYWQLNDCWPVASWSGTDYYHKWKAMHYMTRDMYAPVIITAKKKDDSLSFNVVSDLTEPIRLEMAITLLNLNGEIIRRYNDTLEIGANSSSRVKAIAQDELLMGMEPADMVVNMMLTNTEGIVAENNLFMVYPKEMYLVDTDPTIVIEKEAGETYLLLQSDTFLHAVCILTPGIKATPDNNYFDMIPGRVYRIKMVGLENSPLTVNDIRIMSVNSIANGG